MVILNIWDYMQIFYNFSHQRLEVTTPVMCFINIFSKLKAKHDVGLTCFQKCLSDDHHALFL